MSTRISENLIRQFLLEEAVASGDVQTLREQGYIETEYEKYKSGKLEINFSIFLKWLEEKQKNSIQFGKFLLENEFLQPMNHATEITSDASISCTKNILFPLRTNLILSPAGEGSTGHYTVPTQRGILVIHGVYINQQAHIMKTCHKNCFIAGYMEGTNRKYNELLLDYYERLKAALHLLKPFPDSTLDPKVKFIEEGKAHILIRSRDKQQLRGLAKRVHGYKYDDECSRVSDR